MSYCRWSSDDYQCDIYCYEAVGGGFVVHVAAHRPVLDGRVPPPVPLTPENAGAYVKRHKALMRWLDEVDYRPIGLPHDGEAFSDDTALECAVRLEALQALGYNVPQYAIDALREEAAEQKGTE